MKVRFGFIAGPGHSQGKALLDFIRTRTQQIQLTLISFFLIVCCLTSGGLTSLSRHYTHPTIPIRLTQCPCPLMVSPQLNSESIPALLSGPDPADILKEGVQDIDKPPIIIKAPTTEDLAQFASRPETLLPVDSTSRSNTPKTGKTTPPGKTPPKTPAASKPGSSEVAAETSTLAVQVSDRNRAS